MIYLFESQLPESKSVFFALRYIYGINKFYTKLLCRITGITKNLKIKDLSNEKINKLIRAAEALELQLAGNLKKLNLLNDKRLLSIKSYRGLRKIRGLPIRGQRTHTNAKTARRRI